MVQHFKYSEVSNRISSYVLVCLLGIKKVLRAVLISNLFLIHQGNKKNCKIINGIIWNWMINERPSSYMYHCVWFN